MRVLLDENIDWKLARAFDPGHEVVTMRERGWLGMQNGTLLRAAALEFDILLTVDRNMQHQQHLSGHDLAVVLVTARSNALRSLLPAMPAVNLLLAGVKPGRLYVVAA